MFTGITQGKFKIVDIIEKTNLKTLAVELSEKLLENLKIGASVAVSGVCLTVTEIRNNNVLFDVMLETLNKTTLKTLQIGDSVNIERSARLGDEVGGHKVSGHVSAVAEIVDIEESKNNKAITFQCDLEWMKYIFAKGFIALDGCSLTITDPDQESGKFVVWFIPETLETTIFGDKQVGDKVNLEIDPHTQMVVDTVERMQKDNI